jgi:hypothetical protein
MMGMGEDTRMSVALLKALRDGDDGVAPLVDWCLEQDDPVRVLADLDVRLEAVRIQVLLRLAGQSAGHALLELPWWRALHGTGLPVRVRRVLNRLGVHTLGELAQHTPGDFLSLKNFGPASFRQLRAALWDRCGLRLRGDHGEDEETLLKAARA